MNGIGSPRVDSPPRTVPAGKVEASNVVTYKDRTIKARIDPTLPVKNVVQQLALTFKTAEVYQTLALRDQSGELVTDINLSGCIQKKSPLSLVSSPSIEALDTISALSYALRPLTPLPSSPSGRVTIPLKLSLFNLVKFMKEEEFASTFLKKGGLDLLVGLVIAGEAANLASPSPAEKSSAKGKEKEVAVLSGNALAYALQGLSLILETENLDGPIKDSLIDRMIYVIATVRSANICRPSINVLGQLLRSPPSNTHLSPGVGATRTNNSSPDTDPSTPKRASPANQELQVMQGSPASRSQSISASSTKESSMGRGQALPMHSFESVYEKMKQMPGCLAQLVQRMEGGDLEMGISSLSLVNDLIRLGLGSGSFGRLVQDLETVRVASVVSRLMSIHDSTDLRTPILYYQDLHLSILRHLMDTPTNFQHSDQMGKLEFIWTESRFGEERSPGAQRVNWERLGLDGREGLFKVGGVLGLDCLFSFARGDRDYADIVQEQEGACPIGRSSGACVAVIVEYYEGLRSRQQLHTAFHPFLISFTRIHALILKLFVRVWQDSSAVAADFPRVTTLVRSYLAYVLSPEGGTGGAWHKLEMALNETPYRTIRERQIAEVERQARREDGAVSELREKLNGEALTFVKHQRIQRMRTGSWFHVGVTLSSTGITPNQNDSSRPWRFAKITADSKSVIWQDFRTVLPETPFDDEEPEHRLDLSSVTEVRPSSSRALSTPTQTIPSQISFSLLSGGEKSLLDLVAVDNDQFAEWIDGLRILFNNDPDSESEMTRATARYLHSLTDIGVQLRIMDISKDGARPQKKPYGLPPTSSDFYFA